MIHNDKMTPTITIAGVWGYSANMTGFTLLFWFSWPHPLSPFDFQSAMRERNISAYDSWRPQLVPLSSSPPWERENDLPTTHDVQLPVPLFSSPACEWEKVICLRLLCPLSYQSPWFPGRTEWESNINWLRLMASTYQTLWPGIQIFELGVQIFL